MTEHYKKSGNKDDTCKSSFNFHLKWTELQQHSVQHCSQQGTLLDQRV